MGKKKVLIVDNEKDVLAVLERGLIAQGYSVMTADNGNDAIMLAKSGLPDLVILDVLMPGMDGGEVAFKLKEDSATKDIPVVFSTCLLSSSESYRRAHNCGGNIIFAKSNDTIELIALVDDILSSRD